MTRLNPGYTVPFAPLLGPVDREWLLACLDQAAEYDVNDNATYLEVISMLRTAVLNA